MKAEPAVAATDALAGEGAAAQQPVWRSDPLSNNPPGYCPLHLCRKPSDDAAVVVDAVWPR